jgi:1-acyl-sn-glycerol-3-phosphate acyltransferase
MNVMLKPLQWFYCLYAILLFLSLMVLVFPWVFIASFWGKVRGGDFIYGLCRIWSDIWLFAIGIRHQNIFESAPQKAKQYIFVANHMSYLDIPIILKTIRHHRIRVLGKAEMKRIPIFGFIYASSVVMVDRNSPDQRSKSVRILTSVLRKGISVVIFPEGTFNETNQPLKDFYDGAFRIAIDTHTTLKPILFLDTYDRLNYRSILALTPGKSRAVFLEDVPVDGLLPGDVNHLKMQVHMQMSAKLLEYRASWIKPESKVEL